MLRSFEIDNFRGFKHLEDGGWSRLNLVAGKNNTGKTALLEAILLHFSPLQPQLATGFSHRGENRSGIPALPLGLRYEDEWLGLFFDRSAANPIVLASVTSDGVRRELAVSLREARVQTIEAGPRGRSELPGGDAEALQASGTELAYTFRDAEGVRAEAVATPSLTSTAGMPRERLTISRTHRGALSLPTARLLTTDRQPRSQVAEQYSRLRDARRHVPIDEVLRQLDPRLRNLEIRVEAKRPELAADLGLTQLVPLRMMGEGITRIVEILIAIFSTDGGIVLVDEIENGLHYSVLVEVWNAIAHAARASNVQVIATTHSWECIRAAHQFFSNEVTYDFRLHRLDRDDRNVTATILGKSAVDASLAMGLEVRG